MRENQRYILSGMQILLKQKWVADQALIIENQTIKAIIPNEMIQHHLPARHKVFPHNFYLAPGMIDLHIHGAHGNDVMDADLAALNKISHALAMEGVTGFLATTMTADNQTIEKVLQIIPTAMQSKEGAAILGVHLEGPFIAAAKAGAQLAQYTQTPNKKLFDQWQAAAKGSIKLVTVAPELAHADDFIRHLHNANIIAAVGHTHATFAETNVAITAGCSYATHLFNAMRGMQQREPGAAGALLLSDKVTAELIVDGLHLHPAIVQLALRVKGIEHLILVTDAMRAKCMGNGKYELGGQDVLVNQGKATLADGTLAGSTLKMPQALKNIISQTQCSLVDALTMVTINPAKVLGLGDKKGRIDIGFDADLLVMNPALDVVFTMRAGNVVFEA